MSTGRPSIRYFVSLDGTEHEVVINRSNGGLDIQLDGRRVEADLALVNEPSLYSLLLDGRSRQMILQREGDRVLVSLDGERIEVRVRDEVARVLSLIGGSTSTGAEVQAPMSGVVVRIPVAVGDRVARGQPVAVVEAMKMQNELLADRPAIVERILVREGQTVDGDAVLVVLTPLPE